MDAGNEDEGIHMRCVRSDQYWIRRSGKVMQYEGERAEKREAKETRRKLNCLEVEEAL